MKYECDITGYPIKTPTDVIIHRIKDLGVGLPRIGNYSSGRYRLQQRRDVIGGNGLSLTCFRSHRHGWVNSSWEFEGRSGNRISLAHAASITAISSELKVEIDGLQMWIDKK